jgi:hypothetical protein
MEDLVAIGLSVIFFGFQIFSCIGTFLAPIGIVILFNYTRYQNAEKQKNTWKELAQAHQWTFIPGKWQLFGSTGASIRGEYRDCYLSLETFQSGYGNHSQTYTRLSLRTRQARTEAISLSEFALGQPLSVKEILQLLTSGQEQFLSKGTIQVLNKGQYLIYTQKGVETTSPYLQSLLDLLVELTGTYPRVLALGGEGVTALHSLANHNSFFQPVARQLLIDIAEHTQQWPNGYNILNLFCPRCLTHCTSHKLELAWPQSVTHYGCRTCQQSREFWEGPLVAVLDSQMETEWAEQHNRVRINWFQRRELFDFSRIEIIQATDEEVERFAVQAGNDPDEGRRPYYREMPCVVSAQRQLSENTLRILERIFGEVRVEDLSEVTGRSLPVEQRDPEETQSATEETERATGQ